MCDYIVKCHTHKNDSTLFVASKKKMTKYQQERNRNIRKTANIYRRTAEQIESDMRRKEVAKAQAALDKKHGEEMAQPLAYWKKELIDK